MSVINMNESNKEPSLKKQSTQKQGCSNYTHAPSDYSHSEPLVSVKDDSHKGPVLMGQRLADVTQLRSQQWPRQKSSKRPCPSITSDTHESSTLRSNSNSSKKRRARVSRPLNSFMIFSNEHRAMLRSEHPEKDNKEISKMLGSKWASLNKLDRQKYFDRARELAEKHKIDHPEWKFTRNTKKRKGKGEESDANTHPIERKPNEITISANRVEMPNAPVKGEQASPTNVWPYLLPQGLTVSQEYQFGKLAQMQLQAMIRQQELKLQSNLNQTVPHDPPQYVPPPPIDSK